MKRFWIGLAMLVLLLITAVLAQHRMERIHTPCAMDLQWSADRAREGDWTAAGELAHRAREAWTGNWHLTAVLANHQPIDEVDALFEELEVYLDRRETTAYCAACVFLSQRVIDLGESFRLNWWNLL